MATNHINYLSRDFDSIKSDIIAYAKQSYPQLSDNFGNDTSISSFIVDALSDCADSLNYHIDRTFQNTQLNSANSRQSLLNIARSNGLKVPGPKAGMCEVQFSCILPTNNSNNDISQPNWDAAPVIQRNCVIGAGNLVYTIGENVDFREQFNAQSYSNRSYAARRDSNGNIKDYIVTKSVIATAGQRKVYKKVLTTNDVVPFMEVLLPDLNVMNVESVIFKASSDLNASPEMSEYYVDKEKFKFRNEGLTTYRFFEVESLVDQWRWGSDTGTGNTEVYQDYSGGTRYYVGNWKPLKQKFITEFTDNGYLKIIFGPGVEYQSLPTGHTYAEYCMCKVMNNEMLGVLPKVGWTMYVLYNVGGGVNTNVAQGAITTIKSMQVDFPLLNNPTLKTQILQSIAVTNTTPSLAGKDAPSTDELKYMIKYNTGAQNRCVTVKDYELRAMMMPPKYGAPFRCSAIEENNKIVLNVLGLSSDGTLSKALPSTLLDNMVKYLSHYKSIGDYVEIKSGKIYNIGFLIDTFIDKGYNAKDVITSIINTVKSYFDINSLSMGEDIFVGDLYKEISNLDGVIGLIDLRIYKITDGGYSSDKCPLPSIEDTNYSKCDTETDTAYKLEDTNATVERIDLDAIDSVLLGDCVAMYEIRNPNVDIKVRVKQK